MLSISSGVLFSFILKKNEEAKNQSNKKELTDKNEKKISLNSSKSLGPSTFKQVLSKSDLQETSEALTPGYYFTPTFFFMNN